MSSEAIIAFAFLLFIIGVMVTVESSAITSAKESISAFDAKLEAVKCAIIADAIYSNSGGISSGIETHCFVAEENKIGSRNSGVEKYCQTINKSLKINQQRPNEIIVEVDEHYR